MNDTTSGALSERLCKANFPRSSKYDPHWLMDNVMGSLPFAESSFDAIVSFDAYHYFGTDDLYLGYISAFLKPGGCWKLWLEWNEVCGQFGQQSVAPLVRREAEMLRVDDGRTLGFTRMIARRMSVAHGALTAGLISSI